MIILTSSVNCLVCLLGVYSITLGIKASLIQCGSKTFALHRTYIMKWWDRFWYARVRTNTMRYNLTHWGRVTHICVSTLTTIASNNGLSPGRRQTIIWTNAGMLSIGSLGTNFSEILIEIQIFSFKKMHLKMSSAKCRLGLNVLMLRHTKPGVIARCIEVIKAQTTCFKCVCTVYPKKYAHGFCFAVLCCGYTLTDFPISIRLTSLALWQSNDCPSASKATLMNMDKYFMWIHYERLHNHNKAKHNKTVCIFLGIYCIYQFHNCYMVVKQKGNESTGCYTD